MNCEGCGFEFDIDNFDDIKGYDCDSFHCVGDLAEDRARVWVEIRNNEFADNPIENCGARLYRFDDRNDCRDFEDKLKHTVCRNFLHVLVSLYRHSCDIWYRKHSRLMPDEEWDVVHTAGVLIPNAEDVRHWRRLSKRKGGLSVKTQMWEWADSVLNEYTAFCNGWLSEVGVCVLDYSECPDCIWENLEFFGPINFVTADKKTVAAEIEDIRKASLGWLLQDYREQKKKLKEEAKFANTPALPGLME